MLKFIGSEKTNLTCDAPFDATEIPPEGPYASSSSKTIFTSSGGVVSGGVVSGGA